MAQSFAREIDDSDIEEPFQRVAVDEAWRLIEGGAQVVDVQSPAEFARGHIPAARNIPVDDLFYQREALEREADIVVVCRIGVQSALGAEILALLGCVRVYNMEGGMEAWRRSGYPVTQP